MIRRTDSRGRITLGRGFAGAMYMSEIQRDGTVILRPVPEREQWLWRNKTVLAAVRQGLKESAAGKGRYLGSFAQYADDAERK